MTSPAGVAPPRGAAGASCCRTPPPTRPRSPAPPRLRRRLSRARLPRRARQLPPHLGRRGAAHDTPPRYRAGRRQAAQEGGIEAWRVTPERGGVEVTQRRSGGEAVTDEPADDLVC